MVWNTSPVLPVLSWDLRFHEEIGRIEEEKKASPALVLTKKLGVRVSCSQKAHPLSQISGYEYGGDVHDGSADEDYNPVPIPLFINIAIAL